jgi:hypothetical protein
LRILKCGNNGLNNISGFFNPETWVGFQNPKTFAPKTF